MESECRELRPAGGWQRAWGRMEAEVLRIQHWNWLELAKRISSNPLLRIQDLLAPPRRDKAGEPHIFEHLLKARCSM